MLLLSKFVVDLLSRNAAAEMDSQDIDQEESIAYEEDKNRKVLRLLDHGDMVLDVYNVSQIAGLDARGQSHKTIASTA